MSGGKHMWAGHMNEFEFRSWLRVANPQPTPKAANTSQDEPPNFFWNYHDWWSAPCSLTVCEPFLNSYRLQTSCGTRTVCGLFLELLPLAKLLLENRGLA